MCGICGIVSKSPSSVDDDLLGRMNQMLRHRGPDDEGFFVDGWAGLAMRRLSIIDLETGQQPVTNEDKSLWVVFNGEIYNYQALRTQLQQKGHIFTSKSDTEVIVHAYEEYGAQCVTHFNGMFAFAIWDSGCRRLFLARDRLGVKPLYYWDDGQQLIFGSELKAVMAHPAPPRAVDPAALDQFLTLEYIPAPRTIYRDVCKLPAGHYLTWQDGKLTIEQYWNLPLTPAQAAPRSEGECLERLADLITDAVRLRLVSDVPLGAFLSGGIDSGTIVAVMSQLASGPVRTFSIGFGETSYNELPHARSVAARFGTEHHEAVLAPDLTRLIEPLVSQFDEPFGDFSIFPTYLVSKLAGESVKVVLSGDGGDEIFGGYETYVAQQWERYYRWLPGTMRQKMLPALLAQIPPQPAKKGLVNKAKRFVEGAALPGALQHTRWMMFMSAREKEALYQPDWRAQLNGRSAPTVIEHYFQQAALLDPLAQQQYVDIKTYLAENILTKVDRMSMAASIEARVPLLDYRLVEFALSLPPTMKLKGNHTKVILRRAMQDRLPETTLSKSKQGFSIPLKHWLRGPLRPMMTDLLAPASLRQQGYFEPQTVSRWVSEHLAGRVNHSHRLWALMVFEIWRRQTVPHIV